MWVREADLWSLETGELLLLLFLIGEYNEDAIVDGYFIRYFIVCYEKHEHMYVIMPTSLLLVFISKR